MRRKGWGQHSFKAGQCLVSSLLLFFYQNCTRVGHGIKFVGKFDVLRKTATYSLSHTFWTLSPIYLAYLLTVLLEGSGEDTQTDICHVLASLGFIWENVMPQTVAVTSSFFNEAGEKTWKHEKKQRQRDRKEEEPLHSLRHLLVSRTDLLSTGGSLLGCVYMRECVGLEKKRHSWQRGEFLTAYLQLLNQHVSSKTTILSRDGIFSYCW